MDITRHDFLDMLPTVLKHISNSSLVSFDLELSGIPPQRGRNGRDRATLQERYQAVKQSAEVYQILQIGITTVEEDSEKGTYHVRPFNFNLSPMVIEELGIERDFTYSSSAVDFLLRNNYNMELPFTKGIPYLTQSEAASAKERALSRLDRDAIPDIDLHEDDRNARDFMKRAKVEIQRWQTTKKPDKNTFEVLDNQQPLNRFQRRLVHQLVRASFPTLATFGRAECVAVQLKDQDELDRLKEVVQKRVESQLTMQTGFRWVADALAGCDMSELDTGMLGRQLDGEENAKDFEAFDARTKELIAGCAARRKVLIGHNCFLDFVFFFKFFYGDLPEKVEDFARQVRTIFSDVYDTKYMATHGPEGAKYRSWQLWQIAEVLAKETTPTIEYPESHTQYDPEDKSKYHEAGFDSFETAKVFLKLSSKLHNSAKPAPKPDKWSDDSVPPLRSSTPEPVATSMPLSPPYQTVTARRPSPPTYARSRQWPPSRPPRGMPYLTGSGPQTPGGRETLSNDANDTAPMITNKKRAKRDAKRSAKTTPSSSRPSSSHNQKPGPGGRFSHENIYDSLSDTDMEAAISDVAATPSPEKSKTAPTAEALAETPVNASNAIPPAGWAGEQEDVVDELTNGMSAMDLKPNVNRHDELLPDWDDSFWTPYRNKLRCFGTVEEVCDLESNGTPQSSQDSSATIGERGWADVDPAAQTDGKARGGDGKGRPSLIKKVVDLFSSG